MMMMMECETERAKIFWEELDVDEVFDELMDVLTHLRDAIRHNTATDREYVQAMKIIVESEVIVLRTEGIQEVLIDEDILTVTVSESQCSPEGSRNGGETEDVLRKDSSRLSRDVESSSDYSQMSSASRTDGVSGQDLTLLLSPLSLCSEEPRSPVQLVYQPHDCTPACVPQLPAHADLFLGHNPLRVPMLCHFQRHCARVRAGGGEQEDESDVQDADVLYKAPCGRSLRSMEEVLHFLLQSNTLGVLQPSNFSFNAQIVPEHQARAPASPALLFERDLSRGIEPVPVPLFNEVDGTHLKEFRYRKERWPHGCFLSAAPFFSACCDCTGDCADAQSCACVQLTDRAGGGAHYRHQRLSEPVRAGVLIPHASNNSSEGQSHSPSTDQTALPESLDSGNSIGEVNRVAMDIKMMNINDPKASSQTNQFPCPYRGLLNLGATCYLNATLQVLFMTKAFRERVLEAPSDTNKKLVSALKEIFEELSRQDKGAESVSTCGIIKSLGIQKYEQQDAVEYFLDILEKVGHELAEVFSGTLRNIRICSENHKSYDDSPFKSLQIPVKTRDGPCKLEDGINTFFESTTLVEDDQMYCEDCDEKSDTIWSCKIQKYPTILPLHLKRFVYDYRCGFVKNDCPMDIPLHLSLQEHEYSLYAVINHMGSRFGGHYTAVIQSFTDKKWYRFDDSRVTVTDESKLERSGEAYLLLYQKNTPVEDMKEGPETKTAEPGEPVEADRAECDGAHNKPQLEVSAVTEHLRILVLSRPETDKTTLTKTLSEVSPELQLCHGETIKDSLEMCSPSPHMVLWVSLRYNKKDKEAFKEIYRFLGNMSSKYVMTVFICKGPPRKTHINKAMKNYAGIKNNHVLDIGADLFVQVKELVTKLRKTVDQNHERRRPNDVVKTQKRKHEKTEATHEKRTSKKKKRQNKKTSNHQENR